MQKFSFGGFFTKITIFVAVMALGIFLFFKFESFHTSFGDESELAIEQFFFNFNLIYAILAIFTIFAIWEKYNQVIAITNEEAACLMNILNLSRQIQNKTIREKVAERIQQYVISIKAALWEKKHAEHESAYFAFEKIFDLVEHMRAKDEKENMLFDHIIDQLKETARVRAEREALLEMRITAIQWVTLIVLPLGLVFIFFTVGGHMWLRLALLIFLMTVLLLLTFILGDLDQPIGGEWGISDKPYQTVLDNIRIYTEKGRGSKQE